MSNLKTWYYAFGLTELPKSHPVANKPPPLLSETSKKVWNEILTDSYNDRLFNSMRPDMAWNMALTYVFERVTGDGNAFLDKKQTANIALNTLSLSLQRLRSHIVNRVDNFGIFEGLNSPRFSSKRSVELIGPGRLKFNTVSMLELNIPIWDWVDCLSKKNMQKFGTTAEAKNMPTGTRIWFSNISTASSRLTFNLETEVGSKYLPAHAFMPIPNEKIFNTALIDIYESVQRRFPFKTLSNFSNR